ncbi:hypothetical protein A6A20_01790 [Volucribacter amazonae]|uniref:Uncharacterized protein n=2 Tax=Volucribacter amazonae TaxID=256731 RepID=A0A9X4SJR0_9PAST|nr:hypothetical protein [Volucribacter amazonae]
MLGFLLVLIALPFLLVIIFAMFYVASVLVLLVLALAFRFWYITLAIMGILLAPLVYLNNWLGYLIIILCIILVIFWFIPLTEEQKAEIEKAKLIHNQYFSKLKK